MTADIDQPGKLEIGQVISETFGVIGRNFVTFFVLSLLLSGLPTAIINHFQAGLIGEQAASGAFSPGMLYGSALSVLAAVITASVLQGALVYATVQDLTGTRDR